MGLELIQIESRELPLIQPLECFIIRPYGTAGPFLNGLPINCTLLPPPIIYRRQKAIAHNSQITHNRRHRRKRPIHFDLNWLNFGKTLLNLLRLLLSHQALLNIPIHSLVPQHLPKLRIALRFLAAGHHIFVDWRLSRGLRLG
jgi:hypothetical protein